MPAKQEAAPAAPAKVSILDAIQQVTEADLVEIETAISEKSKELDALQAAAQLIRVKLHGKPAKKTWSRKPKAEGNGHAGAGSSSNGNGSNHSGTGSGVVDKTKAGHVYDCIAANGPGTPRDIATKLAAKGIRVDELTVKQIVGRERQLFRWEDNKVAIIT